MLTATDLDNKNVSLPCSIVLGDKYDTYVESSIVLDLVTVFCAVYTADISTKKAIKRSINITAPVSVENIQTWHRSKELIEKLPRFVTEGDNDVWNISASSTLPGWLSLKVLSMMI